MDLHYGAFMVLNSAQIKEQFPVIWVLVADGGRAHVYRYHRNKATMPMHEPQWHSTNQDIPHHELTAVQGMDVTAEPLADFQVSHDGRGLLVGGQNAGHNSCEPHLDIHDEVKENLVVAMAEKLKRASQENAFDQLVIAAPPHILGLLRRHLAAEVMTRVIAEVPKDFTFYPPNALLSHLQETLTAAHVV